jgi:hypothetical protein
MAPLKERTALPIYNSSFLQELSGKASYRDGLAHRLNVCIEKKRFSYESTSHALAAKQAPRPGNHILYIRVCAQSRVWT